MTTTLPPSTFTVPDGRPYVRSPYGTYFHPDTPSALAGVLDHFIATKAKVRVFVGDAATGRAWAEECDCHGHIGRSLGPCTVPLIVAPRESGGPQLLDRCIVGVLRAPGVWAWQHPTLDLGTWSITPIDGPAPYTHATEHNGELHGRHKTAKEAQRLVDFMTGKRMAP